MGKVQSSGGSDDDLRPGKFLYALGAARAMLPSSSTDLATDRQSPSIPLGFAASPAVKARLEALQADARTALIRTAGVVD